MTTTHRRDSLVGLGRLVRLTLRRDRVRLPVWILAISGVVLSSAGALPPLYPDQASWNSYASLATSNPAMTAFGGPGYGFDRPNIGVILVNETQLWGAICIGFMAVFLVNRHTRAEEDAERAEVIRSSVVGRHAPLAAIVLVQTAAILLLGAICFVGFVATGYETVGSLALAASMAVFGLLMVGATAVAAQVASSGRATLGYASGAIAAMFVVRALGDAAGSWVRWLSPLGWAQSGRAFAEERWWPIVLSAAAAAALVVLALWLFTRRDLGSGMVVSHAGPARAARWLTHPVGLAWRLQRGAVLGWMVGIALTGAVCGSIGDEIATFIEDNPGYADLLAMLEGVDVTDAFLAAWLVMQALFASGFSVSAALRPHTEEHAGRADLVLAGPIGRVRWMVSHLVVAVGGTVAIIFVGGLGTGAAFGAVTGDAGQVVRLGLASLAAVPAALVLLGVAVALYGLVPRAALGAWVVFAVAVVISYFGEVLRLPQWARDLSPFTHVPQVPAAELTWLPLVTSLAIAATLTAAGLWGLQRRDIATH
jgi:ABC-2 type transport system permease protein